MTNWKLIFQLSLFGLVMAFATVSLIPAEDEPYFWGVIFLICAILIARKCDGNYFINGLLVSIVNSIWITIIHVSFIHIYDANHPALAAMFWKYSIYGHPRISMFITGPVIGAISGMILGSLSFIASRIVRK
jgi:hypothetical protein